MAEIVLSHFQLAPLRGPGAGGPRRVLLSPDLGRSTVEAEADAVGVHFPGGESIDWETVDAICADANGCYRLEGGAAQRIIAFSELTSRVVSLMPTQGAPTMLISGIPMHRVKDTDPYADTLEKIKCVRPVTGQVLDTAMGLGYTAIVAARTAAHVTTIELDPAVVVVAQQNPWSRELFSAGNITRLQGDSAELVETFAREQFDRIVHDPPAFALGGDLYGAAFYRELWRILRRGGRLFHYIGNPESKSGATITRGVVRRLQDAGFGRVQARPAAFGVVAFK